MKKTSTQGDRARQAQAPRTAPLDHAPEPADRRSLTRIVGASASSRALAGLVASRLQGRKVVVVSNREPVVHQRSADGSVRVLHPASGLTTAMVPIVEACGGVWVAHGSGSADFEMTDERDGLFWPPDEPTYRLRRVRLGREIEQGYYYGLANEGLWPLCHIAYTAPVFRHGDWAAYREANALFARAVLDEIGDEPAVVFINDYHFALLPRMLRDARPDLLIAHFWHIPWPNREVMRVMPWGEEFLHGLTGSDLLGFHVHHHCNNFLDTVDRLLEARVDPELRGVVRAGHCTHVRPFPISIDVEAFTAEARAETFERVFPDLAASTQGQTLLLGVDRLDYTKGIPHRLRIVESLLDQRPDLRGKVSFVQVGAPTRTAIGRYAALAAEVEGLVREINQKFGTTSWKPVRFLHEHHEREKLALLFRRADACLVTSLHDGMNLVAKEYIAAHAGEPGVLLLSKYTGAARGLPEACLINPYDIEGSAALLAQALSLPDETKADAMQRLHGRLHTHDVYDWAAQLFCTLAEVSALRQAVEFPGNLRPLLYHCLMGETTTYPPGQIQTRLANERTLLAWLRTAVALMGFGVMIARLGVFLDSLARTTGAHAAAAGHSRWTGAALLLTGTVVAVIGHLRTRAYALAIDPERRPPSDFPLDWSARLVAALGIALAAFVVWMD